MMFSRERTVNLSASSDVKFQMVQALIKVSTKYGDAELNLDMSTHNVVVMKVTLPSGNTFRRGIDLRKSGINQETNVGKQVVFMISIDFVLECFRREN